VLTFEDKFLVKPVGSVRGSSKEFFNKMENRGMFNKFPQKLQATGSTKGTARSDRL